VGEATLSGDLTSTRFQPAGRATAKRLSTLPTFFLTVAVVFLLLFLGPPCAIGQSNLEGSAGLHVRDDCISPAEASRYHNPYACYEQAQFKIRTLSSHALSAAIRDLRRRKGTEPLYYLEIAELMKGAGDPRAEFYYQEAICKDSGEPAFHLFYADYLRNYRGPLKPLFPRAENEYYAALEGLQREEPEAVRNWDDETARRVERGLIALYGEDGIPIRAHNAISDWIRYPERPLLFISTINNWAEDSGDFDDIDDVRAFTSEALLSALRRLEFGLPPLRKSDLINIARIKPQYDTFERLRFRYKSLPALEFSFRNRDVAHGAITVFQSPGKTNHVRINSEYGMAFEKPFSLPAGFDFFIRGRYARIDRTGLVEDLPDAHELINQYEAAFAASRFIGPDKAIFQANYVYQQIKPQPPAPVFRRDRQIVAGKITYDLLRKFKSKPVASESSGQGTRDTLFELRGRDVFAGVAYDNERYGLAFVHKNNYFSGGDIKGIFAGRLDVGYQATIFTARVIGDMLPPGVSTGGMLNEPGDVDLNTDDLIERKNTQIRQNATVLFRIKDEEREPAVPPAVGWLHPAFIQIVFPLKYDRALDRNKAFENYRIGSEVDMKFYSAPFRGTTYLVSAGYSREVFLNLGKSLNLMRASLSVGF
jgi:hypothetical protein